MHKHTHTHTPYLDFNQLQAMKSLKRSFQICLDARENGVREIKERKGKGDRER